MPLPSSNENDDNVVNGENALTLQYGSGYPSDPKCIEWLAGPGKHHVFGYPNFVRFSWGTTVEALTKHNAAKVRFPCDEEDHNEGNTAITLFFQSAPTSHNTNAQEKEMSNKTKKRPNRSAYFVRKAMKHVLPSELSC